MPAIAKILAREILDSRGNPTVEVELTLSDGSKGRAAVPSGASTGSREALELRDKDPKRYGGKGVLTALRNVTEKIAPAVQGGELDQKGVDQKMIQLDGTENKSALGANAMLGVSMAFARAAANARKVPLHTYLSSGSTPLLPVPMFNVLNGGAHADNSVDFQEFMLVPLGASSFRDALRMGVECYHALKSGLNKAGHRTGVGDEGGFAPDLKSNKEAMDLLLAAVVQTGLRPGKDVVVALDPAASEFYEDGTYVLKKSGEGKRTSDEMVGLWEEWVNQYPIWSIEDGLAEQDWDGWKALTARLTKRIWLVGDDVFVTNPAIIRKGISQGIANSVLIKLNQIGTVTETLEAIHVGRQAGYGCIISHRSGETTDDFIADLAVGTGVGMIKSGAPCRGERVAKYNQLTRIEEELGTAARFAGGRLSELRS